MKDLIYYMITVLPRYNTLVIRYEQNSEMRNQAVADGCDSSSY